MNTKTHDLFPETLLVSREGDRVFTTSLKVAEHFHKRHDRVLRAIEKILADLQSDNPKLDSQNESDSPILGSQIEFSRLNFESAEYTNERGKTYPMYRISHDGFALLAMGFTGKEALSWKVKFLAAFRDMERQLTTRYIAALDQVRPYLRAVTEATEAGLSRAATGAPLGKSAASISYHRGVARRLGLLSTVRVTRMVAAAPQDMQQQGV